MAEAAETLGVTERTFRRWLVRYEAEGVAGVEDRRLGRASAHAVPVDEVLEMVTLYQSQYTEWPLKHFHKRWQEEHGGGALAYMDEEPATSHRTCGASAPAWGAPHEAAPQAHARDAAASRRLDASMGARLSVGSDCDAR